MRLEIKQETSFGSINLFDSFDLNFVQRNNFILPNDLFDLSDSIPKESGTANSSVSIIRLSPRFNDTAFSNFSINPPVGSDRKKHGYSNEVVYKNLQRLCYEVLEPLVDVVGEMPTINSGLLFSSNTSGFDQDSFFADQVKGNAVIISFPDDSTDKKIVDAFNFISEFCLYDRLIYDTSKKTYSVPTISVSVNQSKRKMKSITD